MWLLLTPCPSSSYPSCHRDAQAEYLKTISVFISNSGIMGFFSMFGLAGPIPAPEGRCLAGLLCLEVMGLESDEESELFAP